MEPPKWLESLPLQVIEAAAKEHGLSWKLLAAIANQESAGQPYAVRYEPKWKYFYNPGFYAKKNAVTVETERTCQMMSWSYCQIMGAVARELGYEGPMPRLCDATLNFKFAALKLVSIMKKFPAMDSAISAYNAGTPQKGSDGKFLNQHYVSNVIGFIDQIG